MLVMADLEVEMGIEMVEMVGIEMVEMEVIEIHADLPSQWIRHEQLRPSQQVPLQWWLQGTTHHRLQMLWFQLQLRLVVPHPMSQTVLLAVVQ